jgi:hypothetical protein
VLIIDLNQDKKVGRKAKIKQDNTTEQQTIQLNVDNRQKNVGGWNSLL